MSVEIIVLIIGLIVGILTLGILVFAIKEVLGQLPKSKLRLTEETSILKMKGGVLRKSTCLAITNKNSIRHTNGAYSAGFSVDVPPTMLADENTVNEQYLKLERLLTQEKPAGTVTQIRWTNHLENGSELINETRPESLEGISMPARVLQEDSNRYLWDQMVKFGFRSPKVSVWVKVPTKHDNDDSNNGFGLFLRQLKDSFRISSIKDISSVFGLFKVQNSGIIKRYIQDQIECEEEAEKVFKKIERGFPLTLGRLNSQNLWTSLYLGHNEKEKKVPKFPNVLDTRFVDIRPYLCQDDIKYGSNYVLHGDTPVAVITMTLPPSPYSYNGIFSKLTQNPNFRFRYSLIVEFIHLGKKKSLKKINRNIFWNSKNPIKSPERKNALQSLDEIRNDLASPNEMLGSFRCSILIYGNPVFNQAQLEIELKTLNQRSEEMLAAISAINGANAIREEGDALPVLYPKLLLAEFDHQETGYEIDELSPQLATFAPLQGAWRGLQNPHTILENASGELCGINLLQTKDNTSALGIVLGSTGAGKSVATGTLIKDVLGNTPHSSVVLMDFNENFAPLVEVLGGRQFRLIPEEEKTINIWDYPDLENGIKPTETQIQLVIGDLLINAGIKQNNLDYSLYSTICEKVTKKVYEDIVAFNQQSDITRQPVLSDFLDRLKVYSFEDSLKPYKDKLQILLDKYRGNPFLDAPTHSDFLENSESVFDVYELASLENFHLDVQKSLAYRVASKIISSMGKSVNGKFHFKMQVFDEMHKVKDKYPEILEAITRGARMGRKTNTLTVLATQSYDDISDLHSLTANFGWAMIGKQSGNLDSLINDMNLTEKTVQAIKNINNQTGLYSSFVFVLGSGASQKAEVVYFRLSPLTLWSLTSEPNERNARNIVSYLMPDQPMINVCLVLASRYPRGLSAINKKEPDEDFLQNLYQIGLANGYFLEGEGQELEENSESEIDYTDAVMVQ